MSDPNIPSHGSRAPRAEDDSAPAVAARPPLWRREAWAVALFALVVAALPLLGALLGGRVALAVDGASAHLPWAAHLDPEPVQNAELADQGVQFYPFYRWVARSWLDGDPPFWCPGIYAGAPGFGNAQAGALDPQVWPLVLLQAVGGKELFDRGLGWGAWLRLALALGGGYALARRLGLGRPGALLCGCAFGFSGYQVLWLNHALGHVTPFLPWTLFFLEGIPRRRPLLSCAGAALAFALAILGGHVETAFYVGCAAGAWAISILVRNPRAGCLALLALAIGTGCGAASLLPVYEYLDLSAAKYIRDLSATQAHASVDFKALGALVVLAGVVLAFRRYLTQSSASANNDGHARRAAVSAVLGIALACVGIGFLLSPGLGVGAKLALVPDLFGHPGRGGYRGEGTFVENASAWVSFPVLLLAFAGVLGGQGVLRRRALICGLAVVSFLLAIELPFLVDLYRFVPVVGLGATVRCASVSALMLGLLAGDALESSGRLARSAACVTLAVFVGGLLFDGGPPPMEASVQVVPDGDELFGMVCYPEGARDGREVPFEGWVSAAVPFERARMVIERIDATGQPVHGQRFDVPLSIADAPSARAVDLASERVSEAPADARWFSTPTGGSGVLDDGHFGLRVEFLGPEGSKPLGVRRAGAFTVHREAVRNPLTLAFLLVGGLWVLFGARFLRFLGNRGGSHRSFPGGWGRRWLAAEDGLAVWVVVGLVLLQGLHFARGVNPLVPPERVFPATRTEEILARELGPYRFFSDADVMPPNTGLVRGLAGIQGYDAMDVAAFNFYRENVLQGGVNALLAWTPRGVDLAHPAFRLYGVGMLVCSAPLEHPGWELVASPDSDHEGARAETWIYRARDPLPRAFCVPRALSLEEFVTLFRSDPEGFDPCSVGAIEEDWRPAHPFTEADVSRPRFSNNEVSMRARLNGDGLLILTEQDFPGWNVYVNGVKKEVLTADMIFRGVALEAGEHEVVFRYEPRSIRSGLWISGLSALAIAALFAVGLSRRLDSSSNTPHRSQI